MGSDDPGRSFEGWVIQFPVPPVKRPMGSSNTITRGLIARTRRCHTFFWPMLRWCGGRSSNPVIPTAASAPSTRLRTPRRQAAFIGPNAYVFVDRRHEELVVGFWNTGPLARPEQGLRAESLPEDSIRPVPVRTR